MNGKKQYIEKDDSALKENIYPDMQECPLSFSMLLRWLKRKSDTIAV